MALIRITRTWDGTTLYETEAENIRAAVVEALKSGANLQSANLQSANLQYANLQSANLWSANLWSANLWSADLQSADLQSADLRSADLQYANLRSANLQYADLRSANLQYADLQYANLQYANLRSANLQYANLRSANLRSAKGVQPHACTPLLMLHDQPGAIRAYKLVTAKGIGPFNGGITYHVGQSYEVSDANTDIAEHCGAGINLATLDWCLREWQEGYRVLIAEFTAADIAAIPTATDGKFRVHRCRIVAEKDISALIPRAQTQVA
jgi:uncharacterized protein YjbI with pentapeptide repeats